MAKGGFLSPLISAVECIAANKLLAAEWLYIGSKIAADLGTLQLVRGTAKQKTDSIFLLVPSK